MSIGGERRGKKVSEILSQAKLFFDACETGKGWEVCKQYCDPRATFSCQSAALADVDTLAGYCEWMKNLLTPIPDGHYELKCFAEDAERSIVAAFAVFHGTQSGPGGPGEPTGRTVAADYVYAMEFADDRIRHMTKIWNDGISMQQLGWA
jgi:predicted ester cyclase